MNAGTDERIETGIAGLDEILCGGLLRGRAYLVRGGPGTGKTTLGMHFLANGKRRGERALLITLAEREEQLLRDARTRGIDVDGVDVLDLSPDEDLFARGQSYDIFAPAEVERGPTTRKLLSKFEEVRPQRVFVDALTQLRYLSVDELEFRRQTVSLLRFLHKRGVTVLFTSESGQRVTDEDLQFAADGVIHLDNDGMARTIAVTKLRGSEFRDGHHGMRVDGAGMRVFPRLAPATHTGSFVIEPLPSGLPELDELLHGGLNRGTITIISGPSGVGKTTVGMQFMKEAAGRGERSVIYSFEEEIEILLHRAEAVGIPARRMIERGTLAAQKVEPLRYAPDEFNAMVREQVEGKGASIVMIDSVAGYRLGVRSQDLVTHLHALVKYLQSKGVASLLVNETENLSEDFRATEHGLSYLADNLVFMRYLELHFENRVEVRKAIGVLKKRLGDFEKTLREIEITRYGLRVGKPMAGLSGILGKNPHWNTAG